MKTLVSALYLLTLFSSTLWADERKEDNLQVFTHETKIKSKDTQHAVALLKSGTHANICFSESTDQMLDTELCFRACKGGETDHSVSPNKKGDPIPTKNAKSTDVIGTALEDLSKYESLECQYCITGTVPIESVDLNTLPEQRILPLIFSSAKLEKFEFLKKHFNFSSTPTPKSPNWTVLTYVTTKETDYDTRIALFFHDQTLLGFAMKLNPANAKKLKSEWTFNKNGFHNMTWYVKTSKDKKLLKELDELSHFVAQSG